VRSSQPRTRRYEVKRVDLQPRHLQSLENPEEHGSCTQRRGLPGLNIVLDLSKSRPLGPVLASKERTSQKRIVSPQR